MRAEARPAKKTARQIAQEREYEEQNARLDALLKPRVYEQPDPNEPPPMALIEYQQQLREADARREAEEREERRERRQRSRRKDYEQYGFPESAIELMLKHTWEEDGQ